MLPANEDGSSAPQQHHGTDSSAAKSTTSRRGSGAGLVQRGTREHRDQSLRALKFLQTELSCVVDQSNPAESNNFKALIRGLLVGAFSPSTGAASSSDQVRTTSGNTRGNVQKTSVRLAPSPITSPTMHTTPLFNTANSASIGHSTTRPFLAPANSSCSERRAFDANGGYSGDGDEDLSSVRDPSSMYQWATRPLRRRKSPRPTFNPEELDSNGERIQQAGINGLYVGENAIEVDEQGLDSKLENGTMMEEDVEMEEYDELSEALYRERSQLYERLLDFFADQVKQPKGDLTDLVKVD